MTLTRAYVDGFLVAWEEGEYEAQVRMMRQRSDAIDIVVPVDRGNGSAKTTAQRAQAVRDRLSRTARRVPEVMVKITSSCKGMRHVGRHIDYISRKGLIELEDEDGFVLKGKDALKELKELWETSGLDGIAKERQYRDTINIVFSMPAHTDELSLKRAVRTFAKSEFNDHQFVFAYHTQATDPDPDPPAHPHVHLMVKVQGRSGRRLNPRKADLQRWREGFASELRAHGVEANATSRLARLKRSRGISRASVALGARGQTPQRPNSLPEVEDRVARGKRLQETRLAYYYAVSQTLSQSEDPTDRKLAVDLAGHLREAVASNPSLGSGRDRGSTAGTKLARSSEGNWEKERDI